MAAFNTPNFSVYWSWYVGTVLLQPKTSTMSRCKEVYAEGGEEEERCRLCLEGEHDGPLVQPCACRGSAKLVHKRCLEEWRRTSPKEDAAYRCGQCRDHYCDSLSLELLLARLQAERTNRKDTTSTLDTLATELTLQARAGRVLSRGTRFRSELQTLGRRG